MKAVPLIVAEPLDILSVPLPNNVKLDSELVPNSSVKTGKPFPRLGTKLAILEKFSVEGLLSGSAVALSWVYNP